MPVATPEFVARFIAEFRANKGRVGGPFEGIPLLLLNHIDAESGETRTNPLGYLMDEGRHVIFASANGAPTHPDWYHNLMAHPIATIEVGPDTIEVLASDTADEENQRLLSAMTARFPPFGDYVKQAGEAGRIIPAVVLTPTKTG